MLNQLAFRSTPSSKGILSIPAFTLRGRGGSRGFFGPKPHSHKDPAPTGGNYGTQKGQIIKGEVRQPEDNVEAVCYLSLTTV